MAIMAFDELIKLSKDELEKYISNKNHFRIVPNSAEKLRERIKIYEMVSQTLNNESIISKNENIIISKGFLSFFRPVYMHWTNVKNINSVLNNGLISPGKLKNTKISYYPAESFSYSTAKFKSYKYHDEYREKTMEDYVRLGNQSCPTYEKWFIEFKTKSMNDICIFIFDDPSKIENSRIHYNEYWIPGQMNKKYIKKIILTSDSKDVVNENMKNSIKKLFANFEQLDECLVIQSNELIDGMTKETYSEAVIVRRNNDNQIK